MNRGRRLLAWSLLLTWVLPAAADEIRPGYLQIREQGPDSYELLWKVPARPGMRLGIYVVLPDFCAPAPRW